ncbi:MAG: sulfurtransferase [Candidatus Velthaea sp.]
MAHDVFIDVPDLMARLGDARVRIVDARNVPHGAPSDLPSGLTLYRNGHIPRAMYLDYAGELADAATPYAARVAPPDAFAAALGAKGIGDDNIVVAYDDGTIPFAARIVWMLHYYGHEEAYVLAGGLPAWLAAGGGLATDVPQFGHASFTARPREKARATRDEVLAVAEGRSDAQLLETQRDATYAQRDLDIKGSVRLSGSQLLEDTRGGRVAPPETLARLVDDRRLDRTRRTIVSCGSGVAAAGSYFALKAAGFEDVAVYDGSWMEWEHDQLPTVRKPPS